MGATPTDALLLTLAIWGAIVDSRYRRRGGTKPSKRDSILFLVATAILAVPLFIALGLLGANALAFGFGLFEAAILLFALWELGRWRVRRQHPLSPVASYPEQDNVKS